MRNMKFFGRFLLVSVGVVLLGMGCEDDPDTENIDNHFDGREISANTTEFAERAEPLASDQDPLEIGPAGELQVDADGEVVELTLSGAEGAVTWSVAYPADGSLVTKSSTGATYKRLGAGDNVVTATDGVGRSVSKVIKQPAVPPAELVIGPEGDISLSTNNALVRLTLSGAVGTVSWSAIYPNRGDIVPGTESSADVVYERITAGDNSVRAIDETGRSAVKVIKQP